MNLGDFSPEEEQKNQSIQVAASINQLVYVHSTLA
jgi:hypothetical protein